MGRNISKAQKRAQLTDSFRSQLKQYFNSSNFSEHLNLTTNGTLSFHWANCAMTCELQKEKLAHSPLAKERLRQLEEELESLKGWKIWLKCKANSIVCSLYDLYESYLDPRMRINWFNRQDEILVSLHNEAGPYVALSSMRWMDKEIYTLFVYRKILTGHMTKRDFRLSLNIPMTVYFDDEKSSNSMNTAMMTMCQASRNGVLIKIHGQNDLNKMLNCKNMSFLFNSHAFHKSEEKEAPDVILKFSRENFSPSEEKHDIELKLGKNILKLYGNYGNIKASDGRCYYIFARYEDFVCQDAQKRFTTSMKQMIETMEEYLKGNVSDLYEEISADKKEKTAA